MLGWQPDCVPASPDMSNMVPAKMSGTPDDVERAAKQAIDDAAAGGGFILSTGDQVPRDTPEENLHRFVQVAHEYGKYS